MTASGEMMALAARGWPCTGGGSPPTSLLSVPPERPPPPLTPTLRELVVAARRGRRCLPAVVTRCPLPGLPTPSPPRRPTLRRSGSCRPRMPCQTPPCPAQPIRCVVVLSGGVWGTASAAAWGTAPVCRAFRCEAGLAAARRRAAATAATPGAGQCPAGGAPAAAAGAAPSPIERFLDDAAGDGHPTAGSPTGGRLAGWQSGVRHPSETHFLPPVAPPPAPLVPRLSLADVPRPPQPSFAAAAAYSLSTRDHHGRLLPSSGNGADYHRRCRDGNGSGGDGGGRRPRCSRSPP